MVSMVVSSMLPRRRYNTINVVYRDYKYTISTMGLSSKHNVAYDDDRRLTTTMMMMVMMVAKST